MCDSFGGNGSTRIAAERMGRRCFVLKRDPLYRDVSRGRWEQFAGHRACRQAGKAERSEARAEKSERTTR